MTKWLGWPEAEDVNGHMVKRVSDPAVKVEDRFRCEDCGAVTDNSSFNSGLRGCPARPASLNYLRLRGVAGFNAMPLDQRKAMVRDHWLDFARRIGMPVNLETEVVSDEARPERVMIFSVNGGIYELLYNEKTHGMATHAIGSHGTVQAAE